MTSARTRQKQLRKLRAEADAVMANQREVLEHAGHVVREASRQAGSYARDEVAPRVRDTYDHRVRPVVDTGVSVTRSAAHNARERITDDVIPAVGSAFGAALGALDAARSVEFDKSLQRARGRAEALGHSVSKKAGSTAKDLRLAASKRGLVSPPPKSSGPGKYILIGLGVVAVAAVAYAAYQTLRADDDLWIDDDIDESDVEVPTE
jgi:hypothetical protein